MPHVAMKTLHGYLMRQVLATLVMTVLVFAFVLLLGNVLKEIMALLVNRQATLGLVVKAVALLIPFVLVFALPMGLLTATLLVFGRFSADQELTAARSNGISLISLSTPIILLSVVLSILCAAFNTQWGPWCRVAYKQLFTDFSQNQPMTVLTPGQFVSDFPGYLIYVSKIEGNRMEDVLLAQLDQGVIVRRVRALGGTFQSLSNNQVVHVTLTNAWGHEYHKDKDEWTSAFSEELPIDIDFRDRTNKTMRVSYSNMTLSQLLAEKKSLEQTILQTRVVGKASAEELRREMVAHREMKDDLLMPITVQIHRQFSFSFACIAFTLVGIPLGIRTHRRETSIGMALALLLVLAYYSFIIIAQSLDTRPEYAPHLIVWLPNFVFQAVGAVMLWRANKGI